jgi:plastocyanin
VITGLSVQYKSLDPAVATVTVGFLRGVSPGTARIVASTTSYGVAMTDTVVYTITYPITATVNMNAPPAALSPATVHVGLGAVVTWASLAPVVGDITFDNGGTDIVGGNIPFIGPFGRMTRTFNVPGTYSYKNVATGQTGTVIVHDN